MKDIVETMPGIARIRERFVDMLKERQGAIALHAIAAWDSADRAEACEHLELAKGILHQIAGSAGSLGFDALGQTAADCESEIIDYVEAQGTPHKQIPTVIMEQLDMFVSMCNAHTNKGR